MNIDYPLPLLGYLSPRQFMRRHWQRAPLVVRQAIPGFGPLLSRSALVALAARDEVESRLITSGTAKGWTFARGPFSRSRIPPFKQSQWTLLVQGVDLHDDAVRELMEQFRFIPDARLDDVMISYATDGGGVGPHFDSYDVFLLQAHGTRRWRIGRQKDRTLVPGLPVRILADFQPEEEYLMEPGDLLYLPPGWAHDGVAMGNDCMTYSIGFRVPQKGDLAREMLLRMADGAAESLGERLYRDASQPAVESPAAIPAALAAFAQQAVHAALQDEGSLACALGEYLTEPKANVWFDAPETLPEILGAVRLHRRSRMLYDASHVYLNGESYRAAGVDAELMRVLADARSLPAVQVRRASKGARELLHAWIEEGWLEPMDAA
ncbi:JmjC domain-containing protein [Brachymonas sp. M4Q-1]|uniref:JmjC domain-containing protein n=1 Tax=Brachymonas sp. M4Q-1 TaxID=3416906 RepID=UPI003CFA4618